MMTDAIGVGRAVWYVGRSAVSALLRTESITVLAMNTTDSEEASEATTADYQQVDKVIKAVQYGDLKFVETAVEVHHVSVDTKDGDDCSLLHWAAINNRVEIIEFLLHRKANVNCVGGENKEIPLQWAVRQAHCAPVVQLLISEKSNIHHKSVHGYDALFLAAQACHVHIAYLLLVAHANVDTVDLQNDTPLYWLLRYQTDQNSLDMQRLLIRFNASVSHRGSNDRVALHYVIENVRAFDLHSAYLIYMANHSPAVLEAKDIHGQTPSQVAWRLRSSKAVRFLFDAYMYAHLPKWLPIGVTAASLFSFFLYLKAFDWLYGGLLFVLTEIAADSINQKYILRANSRMSCGFAWGVIISATWAYYRFVSKHLNFFWDGLISIWVVCIVYTLWKSMTTSPQVLRGEEDETSTRTMVSKITEAQSILDINGKSGLFI
ncbi:hypothetical protein EON65_08925 [archaeon]|nr:MAG: hypothetical protein EON65_08925 [archaeon]